MNFYMYSTISKELIWKVQSSAVRCPLAVSVASMAGSQKRRRKRGEWGGAGWGDAEQKRAKQNKTELRHHFHLVERKM